MSVKVAVRPRLSGGAVVFLHAGLNEPMYRLCTASWACPMGLRQMSASSLKRHQVTFSLQYKRSASALPAVTPLVGLCAVQSFQSEVDAMGLSKTMVSVPTAPGGWDIVHRCGFSSPESTSLKACRTSLAHSNFSKHNAVKKKPPYAGCAVLPRLPITPAGQPGAC